MENMFLLILIILLSDFSIVYPLDNFNGKSARRVINTERRYYDVVKPVFYHNRIKRDTTLHKGQHLESVTLYFKAFSKKFSIDLKWNRHLFPKSYIEKTYLNGEGIIHQPLKHKNHCFYHGDIQGVPQSMVAISSCDNDVSGYIKDKDNIYHIEPAPSLGPGKHKIYIEKPLQKHHKHNCASADKHSRLVVNGTDYNATINTYYTKEIFHRMRRDTRHNTTIRGPYDTNHNARFVELFLVNDFRTFDNHGRNRQVMIRRSQDIANIVSRLYKPLNIYVALVGVETWTERDLITITEDAEKTLENFLHYRKGRINPFHRNDNSQLITGETFKDGVLGKAIKASICTHQFSGGVDMDIRDRMTQVATTVAHELGHNFGMDHDNYSICQCPEEKCIMAPTGGGRLASPSKWSSCSRVALLESFELGMDYCLKNKPEKLYEGPVCGNSFVEEGEQCDCGLPEDCLNNCCNATTCRLLPNAQCATGTCCDLNTCRPKEAASLCRGALDECDLPEFCSGTSEYCPDDAYIQDGTSCHGGQAYCYLGHCKTHTLQCKLLWGSTGRVSDPICFQHLNTNGSKFGNCGYDWRQDRYNRCDKDDVMCGLLHCVHLNEKLMFWKETLAHATPATFLTKGRTRYVCRSVILDVGLDMPDPGMAPEGAKCGDKKVCVSQKCMPLSQLQILSCPDCHGNGVCNNFGQCHCHEGFGPPYCDEPGFGGSEHSGPVKIKDTNSLLVGMLVLFLILLPLIGVAIFLGYYHHEKLKKWWSRSPFKYSVPKLPPRPKKPPPRNVPAPPTRPAPIAPPGGGSNDEKIQMSSVNITSPVFTGNKNKQPKPVSKTVPKPLPKPPVNETVPAKDSEPVHRPVLKPLSKPNKDLTAFSSSPKQALKPLPKPNKDLSTSASSSPKQALKPLPKPPGESLQKTQSKSSPKPPVKPLIDLKSSPKPALKPPVSKQLSNTSHEGLTKKDSFNREISQPVLISTTDRRSKAFVKDPSFEKFKDIEKPTEEDQPPVVPPHVMIKRNPSNEGAKKIPARPTSMPPVHREKNSKENRKSGIQTDLKSPERPPPPLFSRKSNIQSSDTESTNSAGNPRTHFDKSRYKIEGEKGGESSNENSVNDRVLLSKHSVPKTKPSGDMKLGSSRVDNKPKPLNSKSHKPLPALPTKAEEAPKSQDSVSMIKAMFDEMKVGDLGSLSRNGSSVEDRPRPPPKPGSGSKVRSVNV